MEFIGLPIAGFLMFFVVLFRKPIAELIGRTTKVGRQGIEADDQNQLAPPRGELPRPKDSEAVDPPSDGSWSDLSKWGVSAFWSFTDHEPASLGALLGRCKDRVVVIKTWFPETNEIQHGLEEALENGASIELILCNPNPGRGVLAKRAESTKHTQADAAAWIHKGLRMVLDSTSNDRFGMVAFHDEWPGVPVIWADKQVFMGFYFWGETSPNMPWIEVRDPSSLLNVLLDQKKSLILSADKAQTLFKTREALEDWINQQTENTEAKE